MSEPLKPTPRTDALVARLTERAKASQCDGGSDDGVAIVMNIVQHARTLERELATLREQEIEEVRAVDRGDSYAVVGDSGVLARAFGKHAGAVAEAFADGYNAAIRALAALPQDLVLVPREPTEAMLNAARDWSIKVNGIGVGNDQATGCYKAMLAAAPPAEGKK